MKIYDISQEVFGSKVYPGDPAPRRELLKSMEKGDPCHLTAFSMCAHNGTHIDAPYHFLEGGRTVDEIPLGKTVGKAFVVEHRGVVSGDDAKAILERAENADREAMDRILIKGRAVVSEAAA